jgi:amino acid permease
LKFSSVAGVISMIFASSVIIAAIIDHQPNNLPVSTIARFDGGLFTAMSLISVAFTMHYNAQRYYQELVDRSLQRMGRIIMGSFTFAFFLYAFVGVFGVLEFDDAVQSNVINNFLPSPLINTTRIFLSLAIIASFPLPFHGCRSNFLRLFFRLEGDDLSTSRWVTAPLPLHSQPNTGTYQYFHLIQSLSHHEHQCFCVTYPCPQVISTVALFVPILGISLATDNVGVVLSFKGSCLSSLVVYIIPGLAYIRLMQPTGLSERFGPWLLVVYGIGMYYLISALHCVLFVSFAGVRSVLVKLSFLSPIMFLGAVYGIVGTYYAAYNLALGQAHH